MIKQSMFSVPRCDVIQSVLAPNNTGGNVSVHAGHGMTRKSFKEVSFSGLVTDSQGPALVEVHRTQIVFSLVGPCRVAE